MANDLSTIQSLKAVDAWIDVINANINGGVRTAFKASRLRFAGSNTMLDRAPTSATLPLQLPEPGLITANTVIDWTQGAITSSTESSHLAIQGEGFFVLLSPETMNPDGTTRPNVPGSQILLTRDGEFHTNQNGVLVNAAGYYLVTFMFFNGTSTLEQTTGNFGAGSAMRAVYNDLDNPSAATTATRAFRLSDYLQQNISPATILADGTTTLLASGSNRSPGTLIKADLGKQNLQYTSFGSTVYSFGYDYQTGASSSTIKLAQATTSDATILSKSLEASNASMTQSVPELSLAQKLFSALTKVLQIGQTNTDSVLNLVR